MSVHGIYAIIYREIMAGKANLPTMPDVCLRIRHAMQRDDYDVYSIAKIIQVDPAVSAYLIRMANSPLYRSFSPTQTVSSAIGKVGIGMARDSVMVYSLRHMLKSDHPHIQELYSKVWNMSSKVAAISAVLAKKCKGISVEKAMLAGLFQDIGKLPLIQQIEKRVDRIDDLTQADQIIRDYSSSVGIKLLESWDFDEDFISVVRYLDSWERTHDNKLDITDVVTIARAHAYLGTPLMKGCPIIPNIPAFKKFPESTLTPENSLSLLEESKEEIDELHRMLMGGLA